jgi:hypothetical protein
MTPMPRSRPAPRGLRLLALVLLIGTALPATACELDGLSHGYGPMSALFAGAHRYQSLNGVEDEESPPEAPPTAPTDTAGTPSDAAPSPDAAPPAAPPRSFVAWAKAKPKDPGTGDAPAAWVRGPVKDAAESSNATPESAER